MVIVGKIKRAISVSPTATANALVVETFMNVELEKRPYWCCQHQSLQSQYWADCRNECVGHGQRNIHHGKNQSCQQVRTQGLLVWFDCVHGYLSHT